MAKKLLLIFTSVGLFIVSALQAQHPASNEHHEISANIEPQPLLAQAIRLKEALSFLGSSLSKEDEKRLTALEHEPLTPQITKVIQEILDPYCLAMITINPESRVKVERGPAEAKLIQSGWSNFLVKVNNDAGVTAQLQVESPNAAPPLHESSYAPRVAEKNKLSPGQVASRFLEVQLYRNRPLLPNLSGLKIEYAVLQIYSKDIGKREAELGFNIGQGTQDIGFRNALSILFTISPSVKVTFKIKDHDGSPAMASFLITDGIERILDDSVNTIINGDFRVVSAQREFRSNFPPFDKTYKVPGTLQH